MANIQIPENLFYDIARCLIILEQTPNNPLPKDLFDRVFTGIVTKCDAIQRRQDYKNKLHNDN